MEGKKTSISLDVGQQKIYHMINENLEYLKKQDKLYSKLIQEFKRAHTDYLCNT